MTGATLVAGAGLSFAGGFPRAQAFSNVFSFQQSQLVDSVKTSVKFVAEHPGAACVATVVCYSWVHQRRAVSSVLRAFEKGRSPSWTDPPPVTVPRPDLAAELQSILHPSGPIENYTVIVGLHGVGKSFAVRQAASTKPEGLALIDLNGADNRLSSRLCEDLNFRRLPDVARLAALFAGASDTSLVALKSDWNALAPLIKAAAKQYYSKCGCPMTLALDNVQDLYKKDREFLHTLQRFAKEAADSHNLNMVFVSSDDTAAHYLMMVSEAARCVVVTIPPISNGEAVKYLTAKHGWTSRQAIDAAEYYVNNVTGGVFVLLNKVPAHGGSLEAAKQFERDMHDQLEGDLVLCDVSSESSVFGALVEKEGAALGLKELISHGLSMEQIHALAKFNILEARPHRKYSCGPPYVFNAFKKMKMQRDAAMLVK